MSPTIVTAVHLAPTLRHALETFVGAVAIDDSSITYWIVHEGDQIKICNWVDVSVDANGIRSSEWTNCLAAVAIVRAFAGPQWLPAEMGFRFDVPIGRLASDRFPNTRFLTGQKTSWVGLTRGLLALPPGAARLPRSTTPAAADIGDTNSNAALDLVCSLKTALKTYLCEGYPEIGLAARIAESSVRTLQRNLAKVDTTYTNVVEAVRFEVAADMLADPDHKIIDIALAIGYEDPSHFARAFRRVSGLSPREFRSSQATSLRHA